VKPGGGYSFRAETCGEQEIALTPESGRLEKMAARRETTTLRPRQDMGWTVMANTLPFEAIRVLPSKMAGSGCVATYSATSLPREFPG